MFRLDFGFLVGFVHFGGGRTGRGGRAGRGRVGGGSGYGEGRGEEVGVLREEGIRLLLNRGEVLSFESAVASVSFGFASAKRLALSSPADTVEAEES